MIAMPMYMMPSYVSMLADVKNSAMQIVEPAFPPAPMHDAVGRALRGLDGDGETDHPEDGQAEAVLREGHHDAEESLEGLDQPETPETAAHAEAFGRLVGREPAERAREEVHEAVARRERARGGEGEFELIKKVPGDDVVHRELDAEAEAVRRDHAPHAVVFRAEELHLERVLLLDLTGVVEELVLPVREVLTEPHHGHSHERVQETGDDVRPPPRGERPAFGAGEHAEVDDRHHELRDAAAEVAPARGGRVRDADALAVEHAGHPELARDERREA
eukprot:29797-Pelagococcus_subviridis.AAC.5